MNEELKSLIKLQEIDLSIISTKTLIDIMPAKIASLQITIDDISNKLKQLQSDSEAIDAKKKQKNDEIIELNEKLKKLQQRSSAIKNTKEFQAHNKEIEKINTQLKVLQNDIVAINEAKFKINQMLEAEGKKLSIENEKLHIMKSDIEKETELMHSKILDLKKQRMSIKKQISQETYDLYINILKRWRDQAVVTVSNETCHGCNIKIPPQYYVEIKESNDIMQCPQCKRIVYYIPPIE